MKHTFQWLLAAVCLFAVGTVRVMADNKDDDAPSVPIPIYYHPILYAQS